MIGVYIFVATLWCIFLAWLPLLLGCSCPGKMHFMLGMCAPAVNSTYKPSGDYPLKLSAAGTHSAQQLISSWKAVNAAQVAKWLLNIKNRLLTSYFICFNLRQADLKAVWKKKSHFSASSIGGCSWRLLLHIKIQLWRTGSRWNYYMRPILTILGQTAGIRSVVWCATATSSCTPLCHLLRNGFSSSTQPLNLLASG